MKYIIFVILSLLIEFTIGNYYSCDNYNLKNQCLEHYYCLWCKDDMGNNTCIDYSICRNDNINSCLNRHTDDHLMCQIFNTLYFVLLFTFLCLMAFLINIMLLRTIRGDRHVTKKDKIIFGLISFVVFIFGIVFFIFLEYYVPIYLIVIGSMIIAITACYLFTKWKQHKAIVPEYTLINSSEEKYMDDKEP